MFYAAIVASLWFVLSLPFAVLMGRCIARGSAEGPPVRLEDLLGSGAVSVPPPRRPVGESVTGYVTATAAR